MLASDLPHRIAIESLTNIQDQETGELTQSWGLYANLYAKVTPFSNKDRMQAQALNSLSKMRCVVRYNSLTKGIVSDMRVKWRDKYYRIDGEPYADNEKGLEWLTMNLTSGEESWQ